jgi:hypothetical protein
LWDTLYSNRKATIGKDDFEGEGRFSGSLG